MVFNLSNCTRQTAGRKSTLISLFCALHSIGGAAWSGMPGFVSPAVESGMLFARRPLPHLSQSRSRANACGLMARRLPGDILYEWMSVPRPKVAAMSCLSAGHYKHVTWWWDEWNGVLLGMQRRQQERNPVAAGSWSRGAEAPRSMPFLAAKRERSMESSSDFPIRLGSITAFAPAHLTCLAPHVPHRLLVPLISQSLLAVAAAAAAAVLK